MKFSLILVIMSLLLMACGQQAQPTAQATQVLETVEAQAVETVEPLFEGTSERAQPESTEDMPQTGIIWHREGGIAGFCDQLVIYPDGDAVASTCQTQPASETAMGSLTPEQLQQVNGWLERYQSFTYDQRDPAVADAMTVRLVFNGSGSESVTEEVQQEMLLFAQEIYGTLNEEETE